MKKVLAIFLTLALTLGCAGALAESVRFVEDSPLFDIEMELPEGATVGAKTGGDSVSIVEVLSEGLATVRITIAASDVYDELSMNDLSDEDIEVLKQLGSLQYEEPELTIEVTPSGNKYIHVCANSEFDVDAIFTLYKGYFVELTQWHEDYAEITEADFAFMQQLLYNLNFLPVE